MFLAADTATGGRSPYDDFWYNPLPAQSAAGVRVNDDTAMRIAVFYACVNLISQDIAKVPLIMYRRKDKGDGRERVTDHPIAMLLRNPSRGMTAIDWKQREQAHQLMRGNAYCQIRTNYRGTVVDLHPWHPDTVRVEVRQDESLRYHVRNARGTEDTYLEGEVLHLRGLSLDGPLGLSPVDQARETLGEALAAQQYSSGFFANDARPSIWMKHPGSFKDEKQKGDWLAAFKRAFGGSKRFSPMLTEYGIEIQNLPPINHADLQFLEIRKFKGNEICAIFRVPPHKVAILERSTNNNIEHQGIEYVTDCLLTHCRRWEDRLALDLLTDAERQEYYFEFNLDALMRGDTKSRFEAYSLAGGGPWLLRNEIRARENMEDITGFSDPIQPVNMAAPGAVATPKPAGPAVPQEQDGSTEEQGADARAHALELQARRRVLNRETRALTKEWERSAGSVASFRDGVSTFYASHLPFVTSALAIARNHAEDYCLTQCASIEAAIAAASVPQLLLAWQARAEQLDFPPLPAAKPGKE